MEWQLAKAPDRPLVTAIVSAYNSERFMRGCLEDLEAQTIADQLEIVVVDSASPQDEGKIVSEFRERYDNISYLRTDDREGVYASWNRAIKRARGSFLTNANTDDRHRSDAFERLAAKLEERSDIALVYADDFITKTENETFDDHTREGVMDLPDFDPMTLMRVCYVGPHPMWRRQLHDEHGYFDESYLSAGDYEFWLQLAASETFLHIPEKLGLYLFSPTSIEHSDEERSLRESRRARVTHMGYQRKVECEVITGEGPPSLRFEDGKETVEVEVEADLEPLLHVIADRARFSLAEAVGDNPDGESEQQRLHVLGQLAGMGVLRPCFISR